MELEQNNFLGTHQLPSLWTWGKLQLYEVLSEWKRGKMQLFDNGPTLISNKTLSNTTFWQQSDYVFIDTGKKLLLTLRAVFKKLCFKGAQSTNVVWTNTQNSTGVSVWSVWSVRQCSRKPAPSTRLSKSDGRLSFLTTGL